MTIRVEATNSHLNTKHSEGTVRGAATDSPFAIIVIQARLQDWYVQTKVPNMVKRATLTEDEAAFVSEQRVARLATADAEGNPHVIPVCYAFDGEHFYTPLDEKPKRVTQDKLRRVRNIKVRPEVALVIDQYDDDWSRLGYILIQGQAELLSPENASYGTALLLLRERYIQYRTMPLEKYEVIAITPGHIVSWGPAISK
jgi:PPOX class probable F420-dependent enzyme